MRVTTAINHRDRAASELRTLWRSAKTLGLSQKEIIEKRSKIFLTVYHCPEWVRSYLWGVYDTLYELMQRSAVFYYEMPDGRLLGIDQDSPDYYEKNGISVHELGTIYVSSGFYWKTKNGLKPFFVQQREK